MHETDQMHDEYFELPMVFHNDCGSVCCGPLYMVCMHARHHSYFVLAPRLIYMHHRFAGIDVEYYNMQRLDGS